MNSRKGNVLTKYPKIGEKITTQSGELLTMNPTTEEDAPLEAAYGAFK